MLMDKTLLATALVETLERRGPLPVGYLARLQGRTTSEIKEDLRRLTEEGIVEIKEKSGEAFAQLARTTGVRRAPD